MKLTQIIVENVFNNFQYCFQINQNIFLKIKFSLVEFQLCHTLLIIKLIIKAQLFK